MDTFTMLIVGQVVGAAMLLVGGWAALVVAGRVEERGRRGVEEMREVVDGLLGEGELGVVESGLPGFGIEVGRANEDGEFVMRVLGGKGGDRDLVEVMRVDGKLTVDDGFFVRLPGADWESVQDPVAWAIGYCASHKDELLAAVEASK